MTGQELHNWLKAQQDILDEIIAAAGREFHEQNKHRVNFPFDLTQCQVESYNLSRRPPQDLCYDRPNTPFTYSLWYHGRRVNTFLSHFATLLFSANVPVIEFFDLGAGTGAVQWGVGLVYHRMREAGLPVPKIKIVNIDISPFMLQYNRDYLWKHFKRRYPYCEEIDTPASPIEYEVNSWNNGKKIRISNAWITASYLFDISDTGADRKEYREAAIAGFKEILDTYHPSQILLLTSPTKEAMIELVTKAFEQNGFISNRIHARLLFVGRMNQVNAFRRELFALYIKDHHSYYERSIGNPAEWGEHGFIGTVISRSQQELFYENSDSGIQLYNSSIKIRREVQLNADQQKAARNVEQPSVIIGPAGCGKSIVITERIKNIVEAHDYSPGLSILLTTFNRELLGQLASWLTDILDEKRVSVHYDINYWGNQDKSCRFIFTGSNQVNIRLLHFDMLPKKIGGVAYHGMVHTATHVAILNDIINEVKQRYTIGDDRQDAILNPTFLLEEYHRVIYGLQVGIQGSKEDYLNVSRRGRGMKLDRGRRELVWACLERYANHIHKNKVASFTLRRQYFLSKLQNGEVAEIFDYVFVDEFQDCTKADFEIFFHLLKDPNRIIIAGDLAQAVQLGKSANVERLREAIRVGREVNDISWNYLEGSYRLPFRICEAIVKVSEFIHTSFQKNRAASILTPYKGAPPGARPIIVYAEDEESAVNKLNDVLEQYRVFELTEKCILEEDDRLSVLTNLHSDSVLRLKGMEKHCVIWSTRAAINQRKERYEFVYTILSRTSSVLIVLLFPNDQSGSGGTQAEFSEIIGHFRQDRIILWDQETRDNYEAFCGQALMEIDEEE